MFFYIWMSSVLLIVIGILAAIIQGRIRRKAAISWPEADAVVVKEINPRADPSSHDLLVGYSYNGVYYEKRAQNSFSVPTNKTFEGDHVMVKINPNKPEQCILFDWSTFRND
jgi:hypothetical protein